MKKFVLIFIGLAFLTTLIGCETIKGIGRDLKNTGENIGEAVEKI